MRGNDHDALDRTGGDRTRCHHENLAHVLCKIAQLDDEALDDLLKASEDRT